MAVLEFYKGKTILITGASGFLGKVVVEKILRVMPDIEKIFVIIREKRGSSMMERFKKEILGSPCFDRLRKMRTNFDEYILKKIVPISADLLKEGLALSPESQKILIEETQIVFHCAASVDFNSRLDEAVNINIKGTLRLFELAKKMKKLENFMHISTCYVNSDRRGWVEEKIYEKPQDVDQIVEEIQKIPVYQIEKQTPKIIDPFPNTYTFTKSLAERILEKRRENIPLTILRPSIIGASYRDPSPGWVDSVSAAAALYLFTGLGWAIKMRGNFNVIGDQIPVDYVADMMIAVAAYEANKNHLQVYHSSSSARNPVNFRSTTDWIVEYWTKHPPENRLGKPSFDLSQNPTALKLHRFKRRVPAYIYYQIANISGSTKLKMQANKVNKLITRGESVADIFEHFTANEWIFESEKMTNLNTFLTQEENNIFQIDVTKIDWKFFHFHFAYGLKKYILKEQVDPPGHQNLDLLSTSGTSYFSDIKWAWENGKTVHEKKMRDHMDIILNSSKIKNLIKNLAQEKAQKKLSEPKAYETALKEYQVISKAICEEMFAEYKMPVLRAFGWFLHKVFKQIYEKVVIDKEALERIMNINTKVAGPVVIIPSHRSYVDFLMISYIFFAFKMKCPHIAAAEDFLNIFIVHRVLRKSGAFFIKRAKIENDILYKAIMIEYVQRLVLDDSYLEFFIEGTRSRSGKTLRPKFGLLNTVCEVFFEKRVPDLQFVPITINYERVMEGETFPYELLGEEKVKESFVRILKAAKILNMNFGRIYVEIANPVSIKGYIEKNFKEVKDFNSDEVRKQITNEIGYEIVHKINDNLVVMPTAMVATALLMNRKGISEDNLIAQVEWLSNEILFRGHKIGSISEGSAAIAVRNAINHLEHIVTKTKKDIFELSVTPKVDYKNILLLSYYRNTLMHVFANEAFLACAISAFGHQMAWKEGVPQERLFEECLFLVRLFKHELVLKEQVVDKKSFEKLLELMNNRNIITNEQGKIRIGSQGERLIPFTCSLIWPLVESYWITIVFLFSLKTNRQPMTLQKIIQQIQWFAESMYEERVMEYYESCSLETIKNAVVVFKEWGILDLTKESEGNKKESQEVVRLLVNEDRLHELEEYLNKFLKNSYAKSVNSPIDIARKTMLVEFPFMAKM